jgi:hypothetical protein
MATTKPTYRRLSGTGYKYIVPPWVLVMLFFVMGIFVLLFRGRRTQLWLGPEHLLLVESEGYREFYKRFDYRDIQAFIIRKTPEGKVTNALLGAIVAILISAAVAVGDPVGRGVLAGFGAFFGLVLLFNAIGGPTCHCQLRTAVQAVDLPPFTRVRSAQKALAKIRERIELAQGRVAPGPGSGLPGGGIDPAPQRIGPASTS